MNELNQPHESPQHQQFSLPPQQKLSSGKRTLLITAIAAIAVLVTAGAAVLGVYAFNALTGSQSAATEASENDSGGSDVDDDQDLRVADASPTAEVEHVANGGARLSAALTSALPIVMHTDGRDLWADDMKQRKELWRTPLSSDCTGSTITLTPAEAHIVVLCAFDTGGVRATVFEGKTGKQTASRHFAGARELRLAVEPRTGDVTACVDGTLIGYSDPKLEHPLFKHSDLPCVEVNWHAGTEYVTVAGPGALPESDTDSLEENLKDIQAQDEQASSYPIDPKTGERPEVFDELMAKPGVLSVSAVGHDRFWVNTPNDPASFVKLYDDKGKLLFETNADDFWQYFGFETDLAAFVDGSGNLRFEDPVSGEDRELGVAPLSEDALVLGWRDGVLVKDGNEVSAYDDNGKRFSVALREGETIIAQRTHIYVAEGDIITGRIVTEE